MSHFPLPKVVWPLCFCIFTVLATGEPASPLTALETRADTPCNISSLWQPEQLAYLDALTDENFQSFWAAKNDSDQRLDQTFGSLFGGNNFYCGINAETACTIPTCFEIQNSGLQPWVYLAAVSVVNLNAMFKAMYDGINDGSNDVGHMVDDLAHNFFKWKDPEYIGGVVAFWITATVTALASWGAAVARTTATMVASGAAGAFSGAAAASTANSLKPVSELTWKQGVETLNNMIANFSMTTREAMETWSNDTFAGRNDANGTNIFDYLKGGSFVSSAAIPSVNDVTNFFKTLLVARMANQLWRTKPVYVVSTTSKPTYSDEFQPNMTFTSSSTGRTYMTYYFNDGKQLQPPGMEALNGSFYGIHAYQVAQSSGTSWEIAGNNYTDALGLDAIALANETSSPWIQQAGFQGIFTLPVCDIGDHIDWMPPYGSNMLPCCCGPDCSATKEFIAAANLKKSKGFKSRCKKQLKGSAINFEDIDYGIGD